MTSGSNCRHLKITETEAVSRSIESAYQITPPKLHHFLHRGTSASGPLYITVTECRRRRVLKRQSGEVVMRSVLKCRGTSPVAAILRW